MNYLGGVEGGGGRKSSFNIREEGGLYPNYNSMTGEEGGGG